MPSGLCIQPPSDPLAHPLHRLQSYRSSIHPTHLQDGHSELFLAEIPTQQLLGPCTVLDTGDLASNKTQFLLSQNVLPGRLLIQCSSCNQSVMILGGPGGRQPALAEGRPPPGEDALQKET